MDLETPVPALDCLSAFGAEVQRVNESLMSMKVESSFFILLKIGCDESIMSICIVQVHAVCYAVRAVEAPRSGSIGGCGQHRRQATAGTTGGAQPYLR